MLAVDTNVVVRYLTGDEPKQLAKARELVDTQDVFASKTVLLETEWVLRSLYVRSAGEIVNGLRAFAGHPNVSFEDPDCVAEALIWAEGGLDFADALHLASAREAAAFVTFDKQLARRARGQAAPGVDGIVIATPASSRGKQSSLDRHVASLLAMTKPGSD